MIRLLFAALLFWQISNAARADDAGSPQKCPRPPVKEFSPADLLASSSTSTRRVHIRLCGVDYWIPLNYFFSGPNREIDQEAVLLTVLFDSLEPKSDKTFHVFCCQGGETPLMNILVMVDDDPGKGIRESFDTESLRDIKDQNQDFAKVDFDPDLGMNHLRVDIPSRIRYNDLYFLGPIESPEMYISCIIEGRTPVSTCSQHIAERHFTVELTYLRKHLTDWRVIKNRVEHLIDSFTREEN